MVNELPVISNGCQIGRATVYKAGLYYIITCNCQFEKSGIYKLEAAGDRGRILLGTCMPEGKNYVLSRRIPISRIGLAVKEICLHGNRKKEENIVVPVTEDAPFDLLQHLHRGRMVYQEGFPAILLEMEDQISNSMANPTGQWSEPKISE